MTSEPCGDFDFQVGHWGVKHRRLKSRLADCRDWETFDGVCEMRLVLGGDGNIEDNRLDLPGGAYRALALRSFDHTLGAWAIWWLDGRAPHDLDVPVIGRFVDGTGTFGADIVLDGAPVKLRFLWLATNTATPRWEQAMSADGGRTWETNWTMDFERV